MANLGINILITAKDQASAVFSSLSDKIGSSQKTLAQKATDVGKSFAIMGTATTGALTLATKTAIDFESAFAGVVKTYEAVSGSAQDTQKELGMINQNFKNMSKEIPVAFTELSKIGELAGQLGVRGVDNMDKFVKTIAQISVATNLTSEQASTDFARIANIMQEPIANVDRMGATIVALGNNFATTEVEISNFSQRIAGAGKIAGISTADIMAIGTAMSSVGVEAEAGGTAVQKVLIEMNTAVTTGNENLAFFAKTAGMTSAEFKKTDAITRFSAFVRGLSTAGDEAILRLQDLGLEDQRLVRAFLSLANAGDLLDKSIAKSSEAWKENTALTEEARKRFATTESQLGLLKNRLALVGATLGEKLLPEINKFVVAVTPMIEKIGEFIEKNPKLTVTILAVVSALGIIATAIFILTPVVTGIISLFSILGTVIGVLGTVMGVILSPIGLIILGIGALIAIGYLLWQNWDLVKAKAIELWNYLTQVFTNIYTSVVTALGNLITWFANLPATIWNFMLQTAENVFLGFVYMLGFLYGVIPRIIEYIYTWFQELPAKIPVWIEEVRVRAVAIWEALKVQAGNIISAMVESAVNFVSSLPSRFNGFVEKTKTDVTKTWDNLKTTLVNGAKSMVDSAVSFFSELPSRVLSAIGDLAGKVRDKIVSAFKSGESAGKNIKLEVKGFQFGGMVSGAIGEPRLAVVHGGEQVVPYHSDANPMSGNNSGGGGGNTNLNINISAGMFMGTKAELRNMAEMIYEELSILARSQNKSVAEYMGA